MKNQSDSASGAAKAVLEVVSVIASSGMASRSGFDHQASDVLQEARFTGLKQANDGKLTAQASSADVKFLFEHDHVKNGSQWVSFRVVRLGMDSLSALSEVETGHTIYIAETPDSQGQIEISGHGDQLTDWTFICKPVRPEILKKKQELEERLKVKGRHRLPRLLSPGRLEIPHPAVAEPKPLPVLPPALQAEKLEVPPADCGGSTKETHPKPNTADPTDRAIEKTQVVANEASPPANLTENTAEKTSTDKPKTEKTRKKRTVMKRVTTVNTDLVKLVVAQVVAELNVPPTDITNSSKRGGNLPLARQIISHALLRMYPQKLSAVSEAIGATGNSTVHTNCVKVKKMLKAGNSEVRGLLKTVEVTVSGKLGVAPSGSMEPEGLVSSQRRGPKPEKKITSPAQVSTHDLIVFLLSQLCAVGVDDIASAFKTDKADVLQTIGAVAVELNGSPEEEAIHEARKLILPTS